MTDRRLMNRMDPDIRTVHLRLEEWARWARDAEAQGWPARTLLGRVIDEGLSGSAQQGRPPIHMPESVAIVDAAVARLGTVDRQAIIAYYLHWEPMEVMAAAMRLGTRQFQAVLQRARWRIRGFIDASDLNAVSNM